MSSSGLYDSQVFFEKACDRAPSLSGDVCNDDVSIPENSLPPVILRAVLWPEESLPRQRTMG